MLLTVLYLLSPLQITVRRWFSRSHPPFRAGVPLQIPEVFHHGTPNWCIPLKWVLKKSSIWNITTYGMKYGLDEWVINHGSDSWESNASKNLGYPKWPVFRAKITWTVCFFALEEGYSTLMWRGKVQMGKSCVCVFLIIISIYNK